MRCWTSTSTFLGGWTLVGGQVVHVHCAERDLAPSRPTDDADAVLDVKANARILLEFTTVLGNDLGFEVAGITGEGKQHRWQGRTSKASIDVLSPDGVGDNLPLLAGVTGSPTIQTPGGVQALRRTEVVDVEVAGRRGRVRRPNLVGALIIKAAAHTAPGDAGRGRHRSDFATLASIVSAADFSAGDLTRHERAYLRNMVRATSEDLAVMAAQPAAADGLQRISRRVNLG